MNMWIWRIGILILALLLKLNCVGMTYVEVQPDRWKEGHESWRDKIETENVTDTIENGIVVSLHAQ